MSDGGRVAVVTGGNRGIGAAVVRRLAASGTRVVLGYRSGADAARRLADELNRDGGEVHTAQTDVTDPAASRALVAAAVERWGRVDVAVSTAGSEHSGSLASITADDYHRVFDVNVAGQLSFVQAAVTAMNDGGRVVMMSSVSASLGVRDHALYGASKAAVSAIARNLAPELGERAITINAVAPGGTNTDMAAENAAHYTPVPMRSLTPEQAVASMVSVGRWAEPDEVAAVIEFLVSPDAGYVSGSTIPVNGGWIN